MRQKEKKVLEELAKIGFASITDCVSTRDSRVEVREQIPAEAAAAVAAIERSSSGVKVKMYDKLKALELLGKYYGIFEGGQPPSKRKDPWLEALQKSTEERIDDLQEFQQTSEDGNELVDETGDGGV